MRHLLSHVFWAFVGAFAATGAKYGFDYAQGSLGPERANEALLIIALTAIALLLIALALAVFHLVRRFDSAEVKLRSVLPSFTYYSVDRDEDRDSLLARAQEIINGANRRIVALNAWREEWPDGAKQSRYRDAYFSALLTASHRVPYRRLVQVDAPNRLETEFDQSYRDHFHVMLDEEMTRKPGEPLVELHMVPPMFPSTFVIVDDTFLIWQLNEVVIPQDDEPHTPEPRKRFRMRGVVIVRDDRQHFIKHFIHTYDRACARVTHAVTRAELGPRSSPPARLGEGPWTRSLVDRAHGQVPRRP